MVKETKKKSKPKDKKPLPSDKIAGKGAKASTAKEKANKKDKKKSPRIIRSYLNIRPSIIRIMKKRKATCRFG
jgi:hypothetical protein